MPIAKIFRSCFRPDVTSRMDVKRDTLDQAISKLEGRENLSRSKQAALTKIFNRTTNLPPTGLARLRPVRNLNTNSPLAREHARQTLSDAEQTLGRIEPSTTLHLQVSTLLQKLGNKVDNAEKAYQRKQAPMEAARHLETKAVPSKAPRGTGRTERLAKALSKLDGASGVDAKQLSKLEEVFHRSTGLPGNSEPGSTPFNRAVDAGLLHRADAILLKANRTWNKLHLEPEARQALSALLDRLGTTLTNAKEHYYGYDANEFAEAQADHANANAQSTAGQMPETSSTRVSDLEFLDFIGAAKTVIAAGDVTPHTLTTLGDLFHKAYIPPKGAASNFAPESLDGFDADPGFEGIEEGDRQIRLARREILNMPEGEEKETLRALFAQLKAMITDAAQLVSPHIDRNHSEGLRQGVAQIWMKGWEDAPPFAREVANAARAHANADLDRMSILEAFTYAATRAHPQKDLPQKLAEAIINRHLLPAFTAERAETYSTGDFDAPRNATEGSCLLIAYAGLLDAIEFLRNRADVNAAKPLLELAQDLHARVSVSLLFWHAQREALQNRQRLNYQLERAADLDGIAELLRLPEQESPLRAAQGEASKSSHDPSQDDARPFSIIEACHKAVREWTLTPEKVAALCAEISDRYSLPIHELDSGNPISLAGAPSTEEARTARNRLHEAQLHLTEAIRDVECAEIGRNRAMLLPKLRGLLERATAAIELRNRQRTPVIQAQPSGDDHAIRLPPGLRRMLEGENPFYIYTESEANQASVTASTPADSDDAETVSVKQRVEALFKAYL